MALVVVHWSQGNRYQPMYGVVERLVHDYAYPCLVHRVAVVASAYRLAAYPEAYLEDAWPSACSREGGHVCGWASALAPWDGHRAQPQT